MKENIYIVSERIKRINIRLLIQKPIFLVKGALKTFNKMVFKKESLRGVSFASSYTCNFKCQHCYTTHFVKTNKPSLSLDEKKAVIRECLGLGAISIDFVGGEIGILDEMDKLLPYCLPYETYISIASNGFEMTRARICELKRLGVDQISISIDIGTEEEHDSFRNKKGSYKRCFEALNDIRAEGLVPIIITTVAKGGTKQKGFRELVQYAISTHTNLVFSPAIPFGNWEGNLDVLCDDDDRATFLILHKQYPFITKDNYENMGSFGCPAAKQILYISEYGDVMPCAFTHISFGNLKYESLREIRERMIKLPIFAQYSPICLAGEDREFINKRLSKLFVSNTYPIDANEAFSDFTEIMLYSDIHRNIPKRLRKCPLCGSDRSEYYTSGREHEFYDTTSDLFIVVKCKQCGLIFLNPIPEDTVLDMIYPTNYYCYNESFVRKSSKGFFWAYLKNNVNNRFGYPRLIKKLLRSFKAKSEMPLKVLDIGCGNGDALDVFAAQASGPIETFGLDFNPKALELASSKGHHIIFGKIEDWDIGEKEYDIIYSSNVVEHVADPLLMFRKVERALKPNGIFLCETPNIDSLDARIFSKSGHWGGFHFPRHWSFFTLKTFKLMAEKVGLKVKKISYKAVPIFWIWTVHAYLYRGKGKKDWADSLFPLQENQITLLKSFVAKVAFTITDLLLLAITGKTSLMSITLIKRFDC